MFLFFIKLENFTTGQHFIVKVGFQQSYPLKYLNDWNERGLQVGIEWLTSGLQVSYELVMSWLQRTYK